MGDRILCFTGSLYVKDFTNKIEGVATFWNNVRIITYNSYNLYRTFQRMKMLKILLKG